MGIRRLETARAYWMLPRKSFECTQPSYARLPGQQRTASPIDIHTNCIMGTFILVDSAAADETTYRYNQGTCIFVRADAP